MKNKRIMVLGVVLVLFALVTGVVFGAGAQNKDGVIWLVKDNRKGDFSPGLEKGYYWMEVYNSNDYPVIIKLHRSSSDAFGREENLAAGETKNFRFSNNSGSCYISRVTKR